jgi:hypothetical protein
MGSSTRRDAARKTLASAAAFAAMLLSLAPPNDAWCASPVIGPNPTRNTLAPASGPSNLGRGPAIPDSTHSATVACTILDSDTGAPFSARACVVDREGKYLHPVPSSACFYHQPAGKCGGYFFTDGEFALQVPLGKTIIGLGHGFEYTTVTDTLCVHGDTSIVYSLSRWIDMNEAGWYSGDCHLHMDHAGGVYDLTPADMWFMGNAEGLNVINSLDGPFLGEPDPVSTPACILFCSEEQRSLVYGHSALMGLRSLYIPGMSRWWPLIMDVADAVHLQPGAAIVSVHPANNASFFDLESVPGTMKARELPLDVVTGRIDGLEVMTTDFLVEDGELDLWYGLLNCGFRLPPTAGSDAGMNMGHGPPLGCFKAYVRVCPATFGFWNWLKELFRGETFITNGPLITGFNLGHVCAGDVIELDEAPPITFEGHLSVTCAFPLRRADIVRNGETLKSFFFAHNQCAMDTTFSISVDESSWIAARVYGDKDCWFTVEDSLFAHTGPIYVEIGGLQILETPDAEHFLHWVEDFEALADGAGEWSDPAESLRVYAEIEHARQHYLALVSGINTGLPNEVQADGRSLIALSAGPNPFRDTAMIRFALASPGRATVRVHAPCGRLIRTVADGWFAAGEHTVVWDGRDALGREAASGVYLCRLDGGGIGLAKLVLIR